MVSQVLEGVDQAAAHCILTGEQEREEDHCHLAVAEFFTALPFRILNGLEPTVKHASGFATVCHVDLAFCRCFNEPLEGNLASSDGPPDFCSRKGKREVNELEGAGDIPILVTDFLGGDRGNVISAEHTQRGVHVEMTCDHHDWMGFSVGADPITEMLSGNLVLDVKVKAVGRVSVSATYVTGTGEGNRPKCFASEKGVEGLAVRHVLLTGKENPKRRSEGLGRS